MQLGQPGEERYPGGRVCQAGSYVLHDRSQLQVAIDLDAQLEQLIHQAWLGRVVAGYAHQLVESRGRIGQAVAVEPGHLPAQLGFDGRVGVADELGVGGDQLLPLLLLAVDVGDGKQHVGLAGGQLEGALVVAVGGVFVFQVEGVEPGQLEVQSHPEFQALDAFDHVFIDSQKLTEGVGPGGQLFHVQQDAYVLGREPGGPDVFHQGPVLLLQALLVDGGQLRAQGESFLQAACQADAQQIDLDDLFPFLQVVVEHAQGHQGAPVLGIDGQHPMVGVDRAVHVAQTFVQQGGQLDQTAHLLVWFGKGFHPCGHEIGEGLPVLPDHMVIP